MAFQELSRFYFSSSVPRRSSDSELKPAPQREFVDKYCIACHNDRMRTAGLTLASPDLDKIGDNAELWEKVLHKVRTGQMPPMNMSRPDETTRKAMVSSLETALDRAAATNPKPGRVSAHRLNRAEYANVIRDLLALDINTKAFLLPDEADEGSETSRQALRCRRRTWNDISRPPTRSAVAVGDATLGNAFRLAILYSVPKLLEQDVRVS